MSKEKQVTKKDIQQLLAGQTKAILHAVEKKIDEKIDNKIDGLAILIERSFQVNQDYMDKKFDKIDERFDKIEKVTLKNHEERLENLESHAKEVKGLLFLAK